MPDCCSAKTVASGAVWVVVFSPRLARFYLRGRPDAALAEAPAISLSLDQVRHEGRGDENEDTFVGLVAARITLLVAEYNVRHLVLCGAPRFLADLQRRLPHAVRDCIAGELDKDLGRETTAEIEARLEAAGF